MPFVALETVNLDAILLPKSSKQSAKSDQGWPRSGNSNYGIKNSGFVNSGIPISISGFVYFTFKYCKFWYVRLLVFLMSVFRSMVFKIHESHTTSMLNFRYFKFLVFQITGARICGSPNFVILNYAAFHSGILKFGTFMVFQNYAIPNTGI